jgi:hypothetical protein
MIENINSQDCGILKPTDSEFFRKTKRDKDGKKMKNKGPPVEEIVWNFYKANWTRVPCFGAFVKQLALLQPTSAAAERVFSMLRHLRVSANSSEEHVSLQAICKYNSKATGRVDVL